MYDFLVVGGGIGGAVFAQLAARRGKSVLVLEKNAGPLDWVRPEILWPATVALLRTLLPENQLEERAILPLCGIRFGYKHRTRLAVSEEDFRQTGVQPYSTNPNQTRELLLQHAPFELRRGMEVVAVLKEEGRIVGVRCRETTTGAEHEFLGYWTLGDDGPQSLVRKACGIEMDTRLFPVDFCCFGFCWPDSLPPQTGRVRLNGEWAKTGILAQGALPLPNGQGAGLIPVRPEAFDDAARLQADWDRFRAQDPTIDDVMGPRVFPRDVTRVRRPWGQAQRYSADGAVLLGDAAHPVSPAGGQGANMSVADAQVLAEVLCRDTSAGSLEEYERRRRPANERSLLFTRRAVQAFSLPTFVAGLLVPVAVRWIGRRPRLVRRLLRFAAQAFRECAN